MNITHNSIYIYPAPNDPALKGAKFIRPARDITQNTKNAEFWPVYENGEIIPGFSQTVFMLTREVTTTPHCAILD